MRLADWSPLEPSRFSELEKRLLSADMACWVSISKRRHPFVALERNLLALMQVGGTGVIDWRGMRTELAQ